MNKSDKKFDVAVIGGGPAGMMAAGRAAELGAKVVLLEKNSALGKKLLLTGNGHCNITQINHDARGFVEKLGRNGKFFFSAFSAFGPKEVVEFFEQKNLPTKVEKNGRVFPVTDDAIDVLSTLTKYLKDNGVEIITDAEVSGFEFAGNKISDMKLKDQIIKAGKFILCTGGKAYPATGSTGDGYAWVKELGHTIVTPMPALAPVRIKEDWVSDLQGLSLEVASISLWQNEKKQASFQGDLLFTHFGLSGPLIINASKEINLLLQNGSVTIELELFPEFTISELDKKLVLAFEENNRKDIKNYFREILSRKMLDLILKLAEIDPDKKLNFLTKKERQKIVALLKSLKFTVSEVMGFDQAMVTSGGVALKEIDPKTMQSKIIENLYFAGEILDLDGPTGGYNLQICWSTGYLAGSNTLKQ
ncbi:MAG: NAD(P)/FAD-dependent oxidoreductase [Candidatus Moranbacteria bacterium]|nr:NAD(P)/FAD-dependent oxidoreductase [Candidatus Moranbacteria bacterium]